VSLFDWNWRPVQARSTAHDTHVRRPAPARCAARVTKTLRRESPAQIWLVDALPHASSVEPVLSGRGPPLPSLPTSLVCLHCPRRMTSSAHGTLVREVSATGHILSGSVCVMHVPHAMSLKDAYVPSMLRSRAPSCSQIVKVLFKHLRKIIMSPKMFTNIFILLECMDQA